MTVDSAYTDKVEIKVMAPVEKLESLQEAITEGTNGTARFQVGDMVDFAVAEGQMLLL